MRQLATVLCWLLLVSAGNFANGQSVNTVKFKVTYDAATQLYTAYVVPDYSVPNSNNTNAQSIEKGSTAQFTIAVPRSFVITQITDVNGTWPTLSDLLKLGPGQPGQDWSGYNLNPAINYYVLGKAAVETSYGAFLANQPVALFTFKGNGCFGTIQPLAPNDPFIAAADAQYGLSVANSFNSRSAQPAGCNQKPLEQFIGITGPPADCRPVLALTANPDNSTTTSGTPTSTQVLANDTNTGNPASAGNVTVSITTPPTTGTATVNTDGTILFTPPANFTGTVCYAYKICDLTSTTVCSAPAQVCVTVLPRPVGSADIKVTKRVVGSKVRVLGDVVSFEIVVRNLGPDPATNIVVNDSLTAGFQFQSASVTHGIGAYNNPLLTISGIASGDSVVMTVTAKLIGDGVSFNYVRVVSQDQTDPNVTNNSDQVCVSVPMNLCTGEAVIATAPASLNNVQWYKGGVLVGSGNSITLTEGGTYTFTASNATCPVEGCCPLIIVQTDCCPVNACTPFVIRKTRSH